MKHAARTPSTLRRATWLAAALCVLLLTLGPARADILLTPTYDVHAVNRTTSAGPIVRDDTNLNVVNHAWDVETYLQFDLSQVQGLENATGLTLRMYETTVGHSPDLKTDIIDLYATGDAWTPDSAYSTMPGYESGLLDRLNQTTETYGWAEWFIDPADIADDLADGTLSLILDNTQQTGAWNMTTYHSSEYDQGQFAPQLIVLGPVTLVPEPSTLCLFATLACLRRRNPMNESRL